MKKHKLQVTQNKCIRFSLKLNSRQHIGAEEFEKINWLPTKERVEQRAATKVFKYWKGTSPFYVNELFVPSRNAYGTRSHMALEIKFIVPFTWNKLNNDLKVLNTISSFTRNFNSLAVTELNFNHNFYHHYCYHHYYCYYY